MESKIANIGLKGVGIEVEYRFKPRQDYGYFEAPDPEEVYIDSIWLEGSDQDLIFLLENFHDEIIDEIIDLERRI